MVKVSYPVIVDSPKYQEKGKDSSKANSIPQNITASDLKRLSGQNTPSSKGKFDPLEALKNFGKGLISPITVLLKHPIIAIGSLLAGLVACSLVPALLPVLAVGFGALGIIQMTRGGINAIQRYKAGEYDGAERAFEDIGAGAVGTAMSLVGLKASARVAAEAKAAQSAIKTGVSFEQAAQTRSMATNQTQNMTFTEALKENASILTTREGRSALIAQLKPSAIRQRILYIKDYFKKNTTTTKRIVEEPDFALSAEGIRRSKLSKADITQEVEKVFNKIFDDLDISPQLRPKLQVLDELRYMTKAEIEQRVQQQITNILSSDIRNKNISELPKIKVFEESEMPIQFTNEQIFDKATAALTKFAHEIGQNKRMPFLSIEDPNNLSASYKPKTHTIKYHANIYRRGVAPVENYLAHEAQHTIKAILRAQLTDTERTAIIQDEIIRGVLQGETEQIIQGSDLFGVSMMTPPKMNTQMRQQVVEILKNDIFPDAKEFFNAFGKISGKQLPPILQTLETKLGELIKAHPEFAQQAKCGNSGAINNLMRYMKAQTLRSVAFSNPEITDAKLIAEIKKLPFTNTQHQEAIQSLREHITAVEGNARTEGLSKRITGISDSDFNQYQFSSEEVLANNFASQFEIKQIKTTMAELRKIGRLDLKQEQKMITRLAELDFEIQRNNMGQQMYQAYTKHINDPENSGLLAEFNRLQEQYKLFEGKKAAHIKTLEPTHKSITGSFPIQNGVRIWGWDDYDSKKK